MSSVKITQLNSIGTLNANTSNTIFVGVDVSTGLTGRISAHTLAQGLFSQESLNVGNNAVLYANTIAQFAGNSAAYLQVNLQNFTPTGSGDFVVSADTATDSTNFIDLGINNSTYSDPLYNATKKLDGYLFVQGPATTGSGGNLVIGTATTLTNLIFIVGGTTANNIVAKMTANGLSLNTQSYITYADSSIQSTAAAPYAYSNVIFAQSNASFLRTNTVFAQSNTEFVQANASFAQSNASFAQANAAFLQANTGFTQANAAFLKANNAIANTGSINANSVIANTATLGNLTLSNNQIYSSLTNVDMVIGQTAATANLVINRTTNVTKDLTITGTVVPQKGFTYTPTIYAGNQTAITIDVANTSVIKANTTAGLVVTLSNLSPGKEVMAWIVNASGTNQTFTHGLSALNSTINATTYNIPGTSTILVRYMCMDATLANAFVAITHA